MSKFIQFMSCSQHLPGSTSGVIAEVLGHNHTGSNEVIVLVQQETGPGELSGGRLSELKARHRSVAPGAALLDASSCDPLSASLLPDTLRLLVGLLGCHTGTLESSHIHIVVVAAGTEICRTAGLRGRTVGRIIYNSCPDSLQQSSVDTGINKTTTN